MSTYLTSDYIPQGFRKCFFLYCPESAAVEGIWQLLGISSCTFVADNAQRTNVQQTKQQCHVHLDFVRSYLLSALRDYAQAVNEISGTGPPPKP
jgi:hypothetical protein